MVTLSLATEYSSGRQMMCYLQLPSLPNFTKFTRVHSLTLVTLRKNYHWLKLDPQFGSHIGFHWPNISLFQIFVHQLSKA